MVMRLLAPVLFLLLPLVSPPPCASLAQDADGGKAEGGTPVNGLRLRLEVPASKDPKAPPDHVFIVVENVGDRDLNVELGYSLNNGRFYHPDAVGLTVSPGGEAPRRLIYFDGRGGSPGRVDPFLVPLPVGSTYRFRCSLRNFVDPESLRPIDLGEKAFRVSATLVGRPLSDRELNLDTQGLAMTPCWEGTVRSNEISVRPR